MTFILFLTRVAQADPTVDVDVAPALAKFMEDMPALAKGMAEVTDPRVVLRDNTIPACGARGLVRSAEALRESDSAVKIPVPTIQDREVRMGTAIKLSAPLAAYFGEKAPAKLVNAQTLIDGALSNDGADDFATKVSGVLGKGQKDATIEALKKALTTLHPSLKSRVLAKSTESGWSCQSKVTVEVRGGASPSLALQVEGNCRCGEPKDAPEASRLRTFAVSATAGLKTGAAVAKGDSLVVPLLLADEPKYEVVAQCNCSVERKKDDKEDREGARSLPLTCELPDLPKDRCPGCQGAWAALKAAEATRARLEETLTTSKAQLERWKDQLAGMKQDAEELERQKAACAESQKNLRYGEDKRSEVEHVVSRCQSLQDASTQLDAAAKTVGAEVDRLTAAIPTLEKGLGEAKKKVDTTNAAFTACEKNCEGTSRQGISVQARGGPSANLAGSSNELALGAAAQIPVTKDGRGTIVPGIEVQLLGTPAVFVPVGFQYSFPVGANRSGGKGSVSLFQRTRLGVGVAFVEGAAGYIPPTGTGLEPTFGSTSTTPYFLLVVMPEAGVEYKVSDRVSIGIDALSFPTFVTKLGAGATYRPMLFCGVGF